MQVTLILISASCSVYYLMVHRISIVHPSFGYKITHAVSRLKFSLANHILQSQEKQGLVTAHTTSFFPVKLEKHHGQL